MDMASFEKEVIPNDPRGLGRLGQSVEGAGMHSRLKTRTTQVGRPLSEKGPRYVVTSLAGFDLIRNGRSVC